MANGKINVTAVPSQTLKENKSRPPILYSDSSKALGKTVVIVGGGSGAIHTVESLREVS